MIFTLEFLIIFTIIFVCGLIAGFLGGLLGLGGAVILTPLITSIFEELPIQYASGISLISALATSIMSGSRYMRSKLPNVRVVMFLAPSSTTGAIVGSFLAFHAISKGYSWILYVIFSSVMFMTMFLTIKRKSTVNISAVSVGQRSIDHVIIEDSFFDVTLKAYMNYKVYRKDLVKAWFIMLFGGLMSGLLGIGGGPINILALYWAASLPLKVASATSNLLVGVTAATSGSLYWLFGYIQPFMAIASVLGITPGAYVASRVLPRIRGSSIKVILLSVFSYLATRMLLSGLNKGHILLIPMLTRHIIAFSVLIISLIILWRLRNYLTE
jgi:hypothetical protein